MTERAADITEPLVVKVVKVSLNAVYVNNWATSVEEVKTARLPNTTGIVVNIADFKSV